MTSKACELAAGIAAGDYAKEVVEMLPDGSLQWVRHELPNNVGNLYMPPNPDYDLVRLMAKLTFSSPIPIPLVCPAKRGGFGAVTFKGERAIKVFYANNKPHHSSILPLQANIGLHKGLMRTGGTIEDWRITAPQHQAAIIRTDKQPGRTTWVMSREPGKMIDLDDEIFWGQQEALGQPVPLNPVRFAAFGRALEACGIDPRRVRLDDKGDNMLARRTAEGEPELVKLDVFVLHDAPSLA